MSPNRRNPLLLLFLLPPPYSSPSAIPLPPPFLSLRPFPPPPPFPPVPPILPVLHRVWRLCSWQDCFNGVGMSRTKQAYERMPHKLVSRSVNVWSQMPKFMSLSLFLVITTLSSMTSARRSISGRGQSSGRLGSGDKPQERTSHLVSFSSNCYNNYISQVSAPPTIRCSIGNCNRLGLTKNPTIATSRNANFPNCQYCTSCQTP